MSTGHRHKNIPPADNADTASIYDSLPELKLVQAILGRAIADLYGADGQKIAQDARDWFNFNESEESEESYGSFKNICSWLNLDEKRVLEALTKEGFFEGDKVFRAMGKIRTGPNKKLRIVRSRLIKRS